MLSDRVGTSASLPGPASYGLYERAKRVLPGGSTRTTIFQAPFPPYAVQASGPWLMDVDGNRLLDCNNNYTSLIHGHRHSKIDEALQRQLSRLWCVGLPTEAEIELAEILTRRCSAVEQVRFTNSGTEAVMLAIRAARAITGRTRIGKCEGAYHGAYDPVEISLDSNPGTWGSIDRPANVPYVKGTPGSVVDSTLVLPFNDCERTRQLIRAHAQELAAVVVDPVPLRLGVVPATREYLVTLRELCSAHGIVLIFDEIISFRLGVGGVHSTLGIAPDLITFGKIIGGGLPIGAVGGPRDRMDVFVPGPSGKAPLPHGGTFNANPLSMSAGAVALDLLDERAITELHAASARAADAINRAWGELSIEGGMRLSGSLFRLDLTSRQGNDYRENYPDAGLLNRQEALRMALLAHGIFIGRGLVGCFSTAMTATDWDFLISKVELALKIFRVDAGLT